MENNYRDMMDKVKASQHLRMEVMSMSEQERAKKTRPMSVRVVMAAACICALLVVGVVAAEVAGFDFVKIFNKGTEETEVDYKVDGSGVEHIPLSAFSQEVQDLKEQYEDTDDGYVFSVDLAFDSWEEAEEYLGYEIMDNPVLSQGTYVPIRTLSKEGDYLPGNCWVQIIFGDNGEITAIFVTSRMNLPATPNGYRVIATLYVGEPPADPSCEFSESHKYDDDFWTVEGAENYLTPGGLETVIVNIEQAPTILSDGSEYRGGEYDAHFFLRGIRFRVWADYPEENREVTLTELKNVLDAFE